MGKYTAIKHYENGNYQSDFSGTEEKAMSDFQKECRENDAIWAYLFDVKTAEIVSSYDRMSNKPDGWKCSLCGTPNKNELGIACFVCGTYR